MLHTPSAQSRWHSEPVRILNLPRSTFLLNKPGHPCPFKIATKPPPLLHALANYSMDRPQRRRAASPATISQSHHSHLSSRSDASRALIVDPYIHVRHLSPEKAKGSISGTTNSLSPLSLHTPPALVRRPHFRPRLPRLPPIPVTATRRQPRVSDLRGLRKGPRKVRTLRACDIPRVA
ncbi:hypothetical protein MRB53_037199 [Persea americana]|nr:hypothetical protein MRB53_037199 [Persea americana]